MTTDIAMAQDVLLKWDAFLDDNGDLSNGDFFDSSIQYSLLGEQRASPSEVPTSHLRRGWIGNEGTTFENGSKLWLYEQSRITRTTLNLIQSAALDSLLWLVSQGYLVNVEVTATLQDRMIILEIDLFRPYSEVDRRFFPLWENTGAS